MQYKHLTPQEAEQLAQTLGAPLFATSLHMPVYQEGVVGKWKMARTGFCLDRGYFSDLWAVFGMPVLLRNHGETGERWETWMSLSPHEIESQELGCRYAFGHAVVMGLGMGWVAVNMALNPKVFMVSVIERDPEVIELFHHSRAMDGLPVSARNKIRIILADALEWRPDKPVDFLYADIWRCLEEPQTVDEVRCMQSNVLADQIYYWGQELTISALAGNIPRSGSEWSNAVRRCVAEKIALPLLIPDELDYPQMIATVARQRRERFPGRGA